MMSIQDRMWHRFVSGASNFVYGRDVGAYRIKTGTRMTMILERTRKWFVFDADNIFNGSGGDGFNG